MILDVGEFSRLIPKSYCLGCKNHFVCCLGFFFFFLNLLFCKVESKANLIFKKTIKKIAVIKLILDVGEFSRLIPKSYCLGCKSILCVAQVPPEDYSKSISGTRTEQRVKMSRMRQRIASRLKEAQNTYAMLTTVNEVDLRCASILITLNVIIKNKKNRSFATRVTLLKMHYFSGGAFESLISLQLLKKEKYIWSHQFPNSAWRVVNFPLPTQ